ncbi:Chaplin-B [Streptomyces sp. enrichment culture]|uniref:chaplin n=1 Tax=Streptomyces TaxID=1883 RepID=UPI00167A6AA8|nr:MULTISPECIES: chaplin family protein [Streptomyces]MBD3579760.1 DUF320 domain-containing protein [Streptomyces sp. KD18]
MRHSRRNGLIATAVAGGGLAVAGVSGFAYADADASGSAKSSPGLLSGNLIQLPVNTPVNVCGNTVNIVGLLNPAAGNSCANTGSGKASSPSGGSSTGGGSHAEGGATGSPGVVSGNGIQLPVALPVNVSGNSVNVVGIGNPSVGNSSVNGEQPKPPQPVEPAKPVKPVTPAKPAQPVAPPKEQPVVEAAPPKGPALAHTGADGMGYLAPAAGGILLGGALLYRRFRVQ